MAADWESLFDGSLTLTDAQTESDALAELPARRGVLLFADADNRPIQLVQTANLRSISRSRLGDVPAESPSRKADLGAITRTIYYACCCNDLVRHFLYQRLCHALFGKDWKQWLALPRREYAVIDRRRAFGCFQVTAAAESSESTALFGPFPTRRAAALFCDTLNTVFELCRSPILIDSGNSQSCPYRQMRTCHGLCCAEHGQQEYAQRMEQAMRCAAGAVEQAAADIEHQMKQAAAAMAFETAARCKKNREQLAALRYSDYDWTGRLEDLRILFIDRGDKTAAEGTRKKVQRYQAWRFDVGGAFLLGTFAERDELQPLLETAHTAGDSYPYAQSRGEHLATIGYFLYRRNRPGLWYNLARAVPSAEKILTDLSDASQSPPSEAS